MPIIRPWPPPARRPSPRPRAPTPTFARSPRARGRCTTSPTRSGRSSSCRMPSGCGSPTMRASARAPASGCSASPSPSVGRDQRDRLADPGRAQRPRRPATPVPVRVHGTVRRPDGGHRLRHAARRRAAVRARELRVPGRAHLLRRIAPAWCPRPRRAAACPAWASAIGYFGTVFSGLILFLFDIPVEGRFVLAAVLFALLAIPIFLVVREPPPPPAMERIRVERPRRFMDAAVDHDRPRARASRASPVPAGTVLLLGRREHDHRRDERHRGARRSGLTESQTALVLLSLTLVAIVMSFVWGCLADRIGPKTTLILVLGSWAVGTRARRGVAFVEWRRCGG